MALEDISREGRGTFNTLRYSLDFKGVKTLGTNAFSGLKMQLTGPAAKEKAVKCTLAVKKNTFLDITMESWSMRNLRPPLKLIIEYCVGCISFSINH